MLEYFLIGCALGAGTGIPIGAVGLAVVDAACRHPMARALGIGLGGGVGDLVFSALGILGIGPLLSANPQIPAVLYLVSGLALFAFGSWHLLRRAPPPVALPANHQPTTSAGADRAGMGTGFFQGFGMVAANPASLVTWTVIVAGLMEHASRGEGIAAALGVGLGSAAWFGFLAWLARRGASAFADRMRWLVRFAGALISGYGVYSIGRAADYWMS